MQRRERSNHDAACRGQHRRPVGAAHSPGREGLRGRADPHNALAEASPDFVWRLQDEAGDATGFAYDPNPLLIVNLSVWESVEALRAFAYAPEHLAYLRRRRK